MKRAVVFVALALAALPASPINKCVGKDGKVSYQEGKCADEAKASTLAAPPARSPLRPEEDVENATLNTLVWAMLGMEKCMQASPASAPIYAKAIADYRREHAEHFVRLERSRLYQERLRVGRAKVALEMKDPAARKEHAESCTQ